MTRQQFDEEIKQLSVSERLALIEAISRSLREDLEAKADAGEQAQKLAAVRRLRGALKPEGKLPSDEEVKESYTDYLAEKYS